jgi:DNA repair photolyase
LRVRVLCAPVLPLINDSDPSLDALAAAASNAGACSFGGNVLFLKPCSRQVFLPFLEERFPQLVRRYRERFERTAYLHGGYPEKIRERIRAIRKRHGFLDENDQAEPELWPHDPQLLLFGKD